MTKIEWRRSSFEHSFKWYDEPSRCTRGVTYAVFGEFVELDDGSHCPKEFTIVEFPDDRSHPITAVQCEYSNDLLPRVVNVNVQLQSGRMGMEVTAEHLKRVRLHDLVEDGLERVTRRPVKVVADAATDHDSSPVDPGAIRGEIRSTTRLLRAQARRRKITDTFLEDVARVYREAPRRAPTKAVRETFSTSQSTAHRWVKLAEEAGKDLGQNRRRAR